MEFAIILKDIWKEDVSKQSERKQFGKDQRDCSKLLAKVKF